MARGESAVVQMTRAMHRQQRRQDPADILVAHRAEDQGRALPRPRRR